jgi:hypothetical protein
MNNINIGIANLVISNKIVENSLNEGVGMVSEIFEILNGSELLQLEFNILDNIENKTISEDIKAMRYIDNNIKLFETYTIRELDAEHAKLKRFIKKEDVKKIDKYRLKLYESIGNLIQESLKINTDVDVNIIHESLDFIIDHIKKNKINESKVEEELYNDDVIEIAMNKFNETYSELNESETEFLRKIINCANKEEMFNELISENIILLKNINDGKIEDKIARTISRINEMRYSEKTFDDDILKLYDLRMGIL